MHTAAIVIRPTYPPTAEIRLLATDLPPQLLIPALADFQAAATLRRSHDIDPSALLTHPATRRLLASASTVNDGAWTLTSASVDHLYLLELDIDHGGMRLSVHDRTGIQPQDYTCTHADIDQIAARLCDQQADRAQRLADRRSEFAFPGGDAAQWTARAQRHRRRAESTPIMAAAATLASHLTPAAYDSLYPTLVIGGIHIVAYLRPSGRLQVTIDIDTVNEWLLHGEQQHVDLTITVNDDDVFDSDSDHTAAALLAAVATGQR